MAGLNVAILTGNLTSDAELGKAGETPVCNARLAVNDRIKKNGAWTDVAYFFSVTAFGRDAEYLSKIGSKGTMLTVQGKLQNREYTNKTGQKVTVTEILADRIVTPGKGKGASSETTDEANPF